MERDHGGAAAERTETVDSLGSYIQLYPTWDVEFDFGEHKGRVFPDEHEKGKLCRVGEHVTDVCDG